MPRPLQRSQEPFRPGFLLRGTGPGLPLPPPQHITTPTPTRSPSSRPHAPSARPPPSFLEQERRGEPRQKVRRGWAPRAKRTVTRPGNPPAPPAFQTEPHPQEPGELLQEQTDVQPPVPGFEKGAFLSSNFTKLLPFMKPPASSTWLRHVQLL